MTGQTDLVRTAYAQHQAGTHMSFVADGMHSSSWPLHPLLKAVKLLQKLSSSALPVIFIRPGCSWSAIIRASIRLCHSSGQTGRWWYVLLVALLLFSGMCACPLMLLCRRSFGIGQWQAPLRPA